ncbi:PREDICTED: receptor-like protein 12 isoform X1 [Camelina sativa]|uniref:Receptor-like protein 12 isoform X1 n=1 Tax=Camelina sativa TaxID=90675 RepID=A0ABM0SNV7_CAMSA|nr:PREDICTED: receptor-like protein 12 isoform X1 [Camelina sativa]
MIHKPKKLKDSLRFLKFSHLYPSKMLYSFWRLLSLVSILHCVAALQCLPDQTETLKRFKNEFQFSSICSDDTNFLRGVVCDNTTGAVTFLELPGGCIRGTLRPNSSLFELSHLRYLNLSFNNFDSSPLSSAFGQLKNLEVLLLSSNGFAGQVPSSIRNLPKLTKLQLSHNKITGNLAPLVQNLTNLLALDLSFNQFSGTIPSSIFTMPFLSYLDLSDNHLTGSFEITNISSSKLETLQLGNNHFEAEIIDHISKLVSLQYLSLSFINISHPIDLKIFHSLQSLSHLDLSGNSLTPSMNSDIEFPKDMKVLLLSGCNISEFPEFLKPLKKLWYLDLSNNIIKGDVPDWLWSLPLLVSLDLKNNSFTGFKGSLDHVLANSSVQVLDIALNSFKGSFPNPPVSIIHLSAWNNSFTGEIPLSVCNRTALDILDLSYNNFTGSIPPCMGNFSIVNLRKNKLEGNIPDEFYSGALTQTFDVGYNKLTGKLPRSLLNCSLLRFLSVDHNRINDSFPFWLKALKNLKVLTLRSNRFVGSISPPDDQGPLAFPKLQILEISHNRFTGTLPRNYFTSWSTTSIKMHDEERLYMGDYSNERFAYEDTLDLQYKGLYMEQGKVLTFYSAIDFSGHIPMSFANVTELESLDLSGNKLSGEIPQELRRLSYLAYIDVSINQLTGRIPQGTQIIGQPKSSFEGNRGLCGLPLEESCLREDAPSTHELEEEEEEEGILEWRAAIVGYGPGVLFGLAIGHVVALYNPGWFIKNDGRHNMFRGIRNL